jgi:hypothetical protein
VCQQSVFDLNSLMSQGGGEAIAPENPMSDPYAPYMHNQVSRYCGLRQLLDDGQLYLRPDQCRVAYKAIVVHGRRLGGGLDPTRDEVIEEFRKLYRKIREWLQHTQKGG